MLEILKEYGTPGWITDSDHFYGFLKLTYGGDFYGEVWLYNNDLEVVLDPHRFRELYINGIFGELWQKVDAVKVLVSKYREKEVFSPDGTIPNEDLRKRLLELNKTDKGPRKLESFFFGKMSDTNAGNELAAPPDHTVVLYLHRAALAIPASSGIVMVRPHGYPFFKRQDRRQYAIVWQLVDQPETLNDRLFRLNQYFQISASAPFLYPVVENRVLKLKSGWSEFYRSRAERRHAQGCDGILLGSETDYLILASNYQELGALEDAFKECISDTPVLGKKYKLVIVRQGNRVLKIVLGMTGEGNLRAAIETWEAIHLWRPRQVLFIGVAGGDPEDDNIDIGDVIVGEQIIGYEYGTVEDECDGKWRHIRKGGRWSASEMKERAERLIHNWKPRMSKRACDTLRRTPEAIRVLMQPIASGNKCILSKAYFAMLRNDVEKKIKAVEMEGDGVSHACNIARKGLLMVRGIIDKCTPASRPHEDVRVDVRKSVSEIVACFVQDLLLERY
jgi:adenosylhomocysteine nucleosidase